MKKLAIILLILAAAALSAGAQVKSTKGSATNQRTSQSREITYQVKIKVPDTCKIYTGSKGGRYFYARSKKTGKTYKRYLPKEK
jgi:uncharacterized protein YpmB